MKYARILNGVVDEIINVPDGINIQEMLHPSLVQKSFVIPSNLLEQVSPGWRFQGGEFLEPLPPEAGPEPLYRTFKSDVWRRCTDAEAEAANAALEAAPVKLRRLWSDSTILEHESPEFQMVRNFMISAFGETRANEILAAS